MMPLTPRGECLGDQWMQAGGIGELAAEISAQFALELPKLLFVAFDLFDNSQVLRSRLVPVLDEAVALIQFRGPRVVRVHQEGQHFLLCHVPRVIAFEPGNALRIGVRRIVRYPTVAMRRSVRVGKECRSRWSPY